MCRLEVLLMADKLEQVAIRMVEQPPLYSNEPMNNPDVAIRVMNEFLSQMDRELFCKSTGRFNTDQYEYRICRIAE